MSMTEQHVTGPVPATVELGEDRLTVWRAWPRGRRDGQEVVLVEGRDTTGRLRAGRLWLRPAAGLRWEVARAQVAPAGLDPKLPELGPVASEGELLVHRFGRRAVVRRSGDYVKVVRPGQADAVAAAAQRGESLAHRAGFGAPAVGAVSPGSVTFGVLPGRSLHELGGVLTNQEWAAHWDGFGQRWQALTSHSVRGSRLPAHTAHDEVLVLRRWLDWATRLEALPVDLQESVRARVEAVATLIGGQAGQCPVVSHRDLHDKQILADGSDLGLLDFDTVALAEPALDLANLWTHALLRADQGRWSRGHAAVAQQAIREVADRVGVTEERFAAYAEASRLRLTCLYAFRPAHRDLALAWAAQGALDLVP